jgi:hypothetical protein
MALPFESRAIHESPLRAAWVFWSIFTSHQMNAGMGQGEHAGSPLSPARLRTKKTRYGGLTDDENEANHPAIIFSISALIFSRYSATDDSVFIIMSS